MGTVQSRKEYNKKTMAFTFYFHWSSLKVSELGTKARFSKGCKWNVKFGIMQESLRGNLNSLLGIDFRGLLSYDNWHDPPIHLEMTAKLERPVSV